MEEDKYELTRSLYQSEDLRVRVLAGRMKKGGAPVAAKVQLHGSVEGANITIREALNQISLQHPHICRIYDYYLSPTPSSGIQSTLLLELMEHDLSHEIQTRSTFHSPWSEAELLTITQHVVSALIYAKGMGICHRDIKPQNLFISGKTVKIGDFGSSRKIISMEGGIYSLQGSPFYLSPELKTQFLSSLETGSQEAEYDPYKSDVYSLGVTLLFMARLKPPVQLSSIPTLREQTEKLVQDCGGYPRIQRMLRGMLEIDPQRRISLEGLKEMMNEFDGPLPLCDPIPVETDDAWIFRSSSSLQIGALKGRKLLTENREAEASKEGGKTAQAASHTDPRPSPLCVMCASPIPVQPSLVPPQPPLCSLSCYSDYKSSLTLSCVHCRSTASPSLQGAVKLPCGHFFHSPACLYDYILQTSDGLTQQVSYLCPECREEIAMEQLERCFAGEWGVGGRGEGCETCRKGLAVLVLDCGHRCCAGCGSTGNVKCGVCQRTSKCRLF